MVRPAFQDLAIDAWVHVGKLGVTPRSICLFHANLQLGTPLLEALLELQAGPCPGQRIVTVALGSRKRALRQLTLQWVVEREELKVLSIRRDAEKATLEMTPHGLPIVIDAVKAWLTGREDFGIGPHHADIPRRQWGELDRDSMELWFWGPSYHSP